MAANRLSLSITDAYRASVQQVQQRTGAVLRLTWHGLDPTDLDGSYDAWLRSAASTVTAAQRDAARFSRGYLVAFITSELGEPGITVARTEDSYSGQARDGRPLREALASPLIGTKAALKEGRPLFRALDLGLKRALLIASLAIDHAARSSLQDGLVADDRIKGYRRAVRGTCGACLGAAAKTYGAGTRFPVHPGCQCVSEPVVSGVRDRFPRPSGAEIFAAMSEAEQDQALGKKAADAVRGGMSLARLVGTSPQEQGEDFITQAKAPA